MAESKRSGWLTFFAVIFAILAIQDFLKPFRLEGADTGIVFLGTRLQGHAAYVGWLVGAFLLVYALGIWRMRRYALTMAYIYALYVVVNIVLFTRTYPMPTSQGERVFGIAYSVLAIAGAWATVILLRRRRSQLT